MDNVTHILPVLHCLKRAIAFVSSYYYHYLSVGVGRIFESNLVYFSLKIGHLVATILMIFLRIN